jgi:hypothetical protein
MPNSPQRWTESECRDRYVQGTRIGLRALALESGVPFNTIGGWSRNAQPTWPEQRQQYQDDLTTKSREKSIEAVSTAIADSNTALIESHCSAWSELRGIASEFFDLTLEILDAKAAGNQPSEETQRAFHFLKELGGKAPMSAYSSVLQTAIAGERVAANLDLIDPNILERFANKQGFTLIHYDALHPENPPPQRIEIVALSPAGSASMPISPKASGPHLTQR